MIAYRTKLSARILFILYLLAVAYLCFWRFNDTTVISSRILGIPVDKLVHFFIFLPFSFLMYFSIGTVTKRFWTSVLYILFIFILGCAIAASTELIQGYIPYRYPDKMDFLADSIALAIGATATSIINASKRKKIIEKDI